MQESSQGLLTSARSRPSPCGSPLLYSADNLSLYYAREQPKRGEAHAHDDIQLSFPLSGAYRAAWEMTGGWRRQMTMAPGTLLLCAPQQPHTIEVSQEMDLAVLWLPAPFVARTAQELAVPGSVEITDTGGAQDPLLQHLCLALLAEVRQNPAPARLYMDAAADLLAAHLTRRHSAREGTAERDTGGLSPRRLKLVLSYIQEHLDQDIALADLAGASGLSPSHFGPLFRRSTGLPPYQYVLIQRIEWAKGLLGGGSLSIGEVAVRTGFCDQSQFARQFKRHVGLTPKAYAAQSQH